VALQMMTHEPLETLDLEPLLDVEGASTETVLRWAIDKFSPQIALACSFQAEESVLIDMMHRLRGSDFRIFTLDTGRLNQETYDCMDAIRARYGIGIEVYCPDALEVEAMVRDKGLNLFYNSVEERQLCCAVRKVAPLRRALKGLSAWMTGLRRDQALSVARLERLRSTTITALSSRSIRWPTGAALTYGAIFAHVTCRSIGCIPRLPEHRLRAVHPGGEAGRRSARRALVVGRIGEKGMRAASD
jgi:hypothetical protein